ncbi:hypothetical protein Tco_0459116 [Tanacetum coccineum]
MSNPPITGHRIAIVSFYCKRCQNRLLEAYERVWVNDCYPAFVEGEMGGKSGEDKYGDEIEVSDDESSDLENYWSDKEEETAKIFKIETSVFDYETPLCLAFNEFNYLLKLWLDNGIWKEPKPVKHDCKPFNYKTGCLEWPTCSGERMVIVMEEICPELTILETRFTTKTLNGSINDDESCNDCWKRWKSHEITYPDHDEIEYENEAHDERQELCEAHELPVCNMRRFKMIKYSFGQDEEYVVVKEDEYDDLVKTSDDACQAYQEIFRIMDERWMVTRVE